MSKRVTAQIRSPVRVRTRMPVSWRNDGRGAKVGPGRRLTFVGTPFYEGAGSPDLSVEARGRAVELGRRLPALPLARGPDLEPGPPEPFASSACRPTRGHWCPSVVLRGTSANRDRHLWRARRAALASWTWRALSGETERRGVTTRRLRSTRAALARPRNALQALRCRAATSRLTERATLGRQTRSRITSLGRLAGEVSGSDRALQWVPR